MSVFFSVISGSSGGGLIDDSTISTETTYSSYEIELKIKEMLVNMLTLEYKEYPASKRSAPQKLFETPNSSSGLLLVLREGVKMALDDDYTIVDSFHISFNEEVPEDLNVFIISLRLGGTSNGSVQPSEYVHTQIDNSLIWNINHKLGNQYPSIVVVDSNNVKIEDVSIKYEDLENCTVTLNTPTPGRCICRL